MLLARRLAEGSTVCSLSRYGTPDRDRREAVLAYAGCQAERRLFGFDNLVTVFGSQRDFDSAATIGRRLSVRTGSAHGSMHDVRRPKRW
jgi:hypothetical protein